ncbi:hypothetical protein HELRODRAFT_178047 [Helobdella robusta]|uniref:Uncharacterized protein n=1 Tax=Helobdella robusta TaxID=6412 RepID=T1FCN8_HELRO|nr:hypothetical protein HELRODRAFT_178047 [Helobdella robusta]ESN97609.1 hypothetical protein HELRODRAFT_178047 [Helobdella robusta]
MLEVLKTVFEIKLKYKLPDCAATATNLSRIPKTLDGMNKMSSDQLVYPTTAQSRAEYSEMYDIHHEFLQHLEKEKWIENQACRMYIMSSDQPVFPTTARSKAEFLKMHDFHQEFLQLFEKEKWIENTVENAIIDENHIMFGIGSNIVDDHDDRLEHKQMPNIL